MTADLKVIRTGTMKRYFTESLSEICNNCPVVYVFDNPEDAGSMCDYCPVRFIEKEKIVEKQVDLFGSHCL